MKPLLRFYRLPLFFFITSILSLPAQATHLAGAEITYTHLTGNMYRLHLSFYRSCNGISAPTTVTVRAVSLSCQDSSTYTLQQIPNTGIALTSVCPGHQTTCDFGTEPGFEKWEYETDVTIASQCPDWTFSYSECCIGGNVQQTNLLVKAMLNNSISDNNSPQFTNNPFFFWCLNNDDHYNNGMFDLDGDSLVSRLIDLPGATYIFPHTGQQPITSVPPITMNSLSGEYVMHPITVEVAWVAYEILDYRNGVLMGSVMRIFEFYLVPCSNILPTASGLNGTSLDSIFVFPDDTVCFDILSDDPDAGQEVKMSWDQNIPSATFDTAGGPHPTGSFCWTPTINDVRPHPYIFTVTLEDDNCPAHGAVIYGYRIYVTLDSTLVWAGTKDPETGEEVFIFPNPSDGTFKINHGENISSVKIFDYPGKMIHVAKHEEDRLYIDVPPGFYWIEIIYNDGRTLKQKLLIKK